MLSKNHMYWSKNNMKNQRSIILECVERPWCIMDNYTDTYNSWMSSVEESCIELDLIVGPFDDDSLKYFTKKVKRDVSDFLMTLFLMLKGTDSAPHITSVHRNLVINIDWLKTIPQYELLLAISQELIKQPYFGSYFNFTV